MAYDHIRIRAQRPVATLLLDRPPANLLDIAMMDLVSIAEGRAPGWRHR